MLSELHLQRKDVQVRIGDMCQAKKPNVTSDCLLIDNGEIIGFYLHDLSLYSDRIGNLLNIANTEFRSERVPKSEMSRGPQGSKQDKLQREKEGKTLVTQYSTIIGSIPPKPHMRRPYASRSSVHAVQSAQVYIKAMLLIAKESEELLKRFFPAQFELQQTRLQSVHNKWRFGNLFTSSISNFNIAAPYHQDNGNIRNTVNVILTKRRNSVGGCLHVPDYDATFEQADNSMLVYPAWRNVHAVTPIETSHDSGYRNSFILYALKAFEETNEKVIA
jgi:hypothetical protein